MADSEVLIGLESTVLADSEVLLGLESTTAFADIFGAPSAFIFSDEDFEVGADEVDAKFAVFDLIDTIKAPGALLCGFTGWVPVEEAAVDSKVGVATAGAKLAPKGVSGGRFEANAEVEVAVEALDPSLGLDCGQKRIHSVNMEKWVALLSRAQVLSL